MSDAVFRQYGAYYDLLYRDKDYAAEADYVGRILRATVPNANAVLELGSGTGRHGRLLARKGYQVFGVERSEQMVQASQLGLPEAVISGSFECIAGDIRKVSLDRSFDAALALFHVISYQTLNADVLQTFAVARHHLVQGAVLFFDVWHGPAVLSERPSVRVKRVEDDRTRLIRIAEPELDTDASVVTVHYTILAESKTDGKMTIFREKHPMRYFFPAEIDLLARMTGFEVERKEEFLTGCHPSDRTWGVGYVLRKRN